MSERNLDFDTVIDRTNHNCLKYDFAVQRGKPEGILPLWVADMDFRISSYIQDALTEQVEHGIYGYSEATADYYDALISWFGRKYNWQIQADWVIKTPSVVVALALAVQAYTESGDSVLIQQPVYYPFSEVITDNGRNIVDNTLIRHEDGSYTIDFQDFEEKTARDEVKLFLLCNPHNPSGRVFTREELTRMGEICLKNHVIVVSDEIHQDFTWEGNKHVVFAGIKDSFRDITITCTSPSKAFNIAGLHIANIMIANPDLRSSFKARMNAIGYSQLNAAGLAVCKAAYRQGQEWLDAVTDYIEANIDYTLEYLENNIPQISCRKPEGTYLLWMDCRRLGLNDDELDDLVINKANLWLDSGAIFGDSGKGFQRINVACPRVTLKRALDQLRDAVRQRN
ncbi:MAG: pyridoxal phosphate-dependent aminotransferase [Eubacterium sp.]|nr:pyridoxal phosphate-dependent aminotransferase [Eubacterium sp.]